MKATDAGGTKAGAMPSNMKKGLNEYLESRGVDEIQDLDENGEFSTTFTVCLRVGAAVLVALGLTFKLYRIIYIIVKKFLDLEYPTTKYSV